MNQLIDLDSLLICLTVGRNLEISLKGNQYYFKYIISLIINIPGLFMNITTYQSIHKHYKSVHKHYQPVHKHYQSVHKQY